MVSLLNTVRDIERLRQIVVVLVKHGFGEVVQRSGLGSLIPAGTSRDAPKVSVGERVRLVLQDLGPSFIKLGQIISTRPDIIPPEIIAELKKLQSDVPPVPFAELRAEVERELGATIADVFLAFDEVPLASASIGQVHRARLKPPAGEPIDGPPIDVVVKIQRPGIKAIVERDVELLLILARAIERSIPESRIYSPIALATEFDRAITAEMDFGLEADHAERFARNFESDPTARFPKVYRAASAKKILTIEFFDGKKVYDAVAGGFPGEHIAKTAVHVILKQIFEDGFFHADPHPGNVLIMGTPEAPVLGLIDLGQVGRLTTELRDRTIDLMVAVVRQDTQGIADCLYAIGRPTKRIDRAKYDAEVAFLSERYLGKPLKDIELSFLIRDIVQGAVKYGLEIPPDFLLVGKALMTVEGVGKEIYPELDIFSEVRPYFLRLLRLRYSPERIGNDALRIVTRLSGVATTMPEQVGEILDDLRKGRLVIMTSNPAVPSAVDLLGRRIFHGLVVASLVGGGSVLLASGATGHYVIGGALLVIAVIWLIGHLGLAWWAARSVRKLRR
ncbi:MAG: hypothetical protein IT379_22140 [Deltaproteobacteria bacterium]|nr:hypothetical protein [Deltaproteobacteria bacterium]